MAVSVPGRSIRVAIQGVAGSFHHLAALHYFAGKSIEIVPAASFSRLVERMRDFPRPDFALMAIENSLAGSLLPNYQLLYASDLLVCGEVYLRITQNLMALPGRQIADLREVHSHPMAIAQCRPFFDRHPRIRLIETQDTADSARRLAAHPNSGIGVIASRYAAECYGLEVLAAGIETDSRNYTRFLVLHDRRAGVAMADRTGDLKISLSFDLPHEAGSLQRALAGLAEDGASLTMIQSAPIVGRPWEYRFFADVLPSAHNQPEALLNGLERLTDELTVLGIYQTGNHYEQE